MKSLDGYEKAYRQLCKKLNASYISVNDIGHIYAYHNLHIREYLYVNGEAIYLMLKHDFHRKSSMQQHKAIVGKIIDVLKHSNITVETIIYEIPGKLKKGTTLEELLVEYDLSV